MACLCTASATALSAAMSVKSNTAFLLHKVNIITSNDVSDTANTVVRMGRTKISIVSAYYLLAGVIAIVLLPLIIASMVYLCLACKEGNILYSPPNSGSNSGQTRSNSCYDSIRDTTKSSAESSPLPAQGAEPLLDSTSTYDSHDASDSCSSVQEQRYYNTTSDEQDTGSTPTSNPTHTP
ncbi:unnamed protein product [Lymnaea stagnalis]|uniref:Uncharacterized protein n=1 Tax=Lymnaea stagnalis TaxID=6523 RepID=A0AAV2IMA1_LYMST